MARSTRSAGASATRKSRVAAESGQARECAHYRNELARHRVVTADAQDYVVASADERHLGRGYTTAAYPVSRGYLVMMRQPLCVISSQDERDAREQHMLLVDLLMESGTAVVRARRRSAAWRRAERSAAGESGGEARELDLSDLAAPASPRRAAVVRA